MKLSAEELKDLQAAGAKTRVVKKPTLVPPSTSPPAAEKPTIAERVLLEVLAAMQRTQMQMVEHAAQGPVGREPPERTSYRFVVNRDKLGRIATIDVIPKE